MGNRVQLTKDSRQMQTTTNSTQDKSHNLEDKVTRKKAWSQPKHYAIETNIKSSASVISQNEHHSPGSSNLAPS